VAIVKLAAMFRHNPDEDGSTIPASLERPDPSCEWETIVDPIVGFMAISYNGRISWSFVKYEAPDARYPRRDSQHPVYRMARMSTTRVGHVTCPACGNSCIYPVWGNSDENRCPACWHKGQEVSIIKETDQEFFDLLGDLRDPLEQAVQSVDESTADEFRFPELMLLGRLEPSASVPPGIQGLATSRGLALRMARETSLHDLFDPDLMECRPNEECGLLILPWISTGILDADKAREGWSKTEGCIAQYVKLPWLPKTPQRPRRFGGCRL